jgi:DNA-binding transcriptional MocR family regulator
VLLGLDDDRDDLALASAAESHGIRVTALSTLHLLPSRERGLLLGFGRLNEATIHEAVEALSNMLAPVQQYVAAK